MKYFKDIEVNDRMYGLVFGRGIVTTVHENGYYTFEVTYENDYTIPYTSNGVPAWNAYETQTVFYEKDIDLLEFSFEPNEETLNIKKILKLQHTNKLMIRCPSGLWQNIKHCPSYIMEQYLEEEKYYLFKKECND